MNFVNLTPHALNIIEEDGNIYRLPPSGQVARVATERTVAYVMDGIEIFETVFGEVEGLPEPNYNDVHIVSMQIAQRCRHRADVYSPGELIRNDAGQVIGCRGLTK